MTGKRPTPLSARLRRWTVRDPDTGCLLWAGAVNNHGYAVASVQSGTRYVHRLAWEEANGPIPDGMELDHLCRATNCVEATHLEPVSHAENMRRSRRES